MIRAYLDMNHFIRLAKDIKDGNRVLYDRLLELRKNGLAVFPISAAHLSEIAAIRKESQRRDLAEVIGSLSDATVLALISEVMFEEVLDRVAQRYRRELPSSPLRDRVLKRGYFNAMGTYTVDLSALPPAKREAAADVFNSVLEDRRLLDLIVSGYFPKIATGGPVHLASAEAIANDRAANAGKSLTQMETECVLGLARRFTGST